MMSTLAECYPHFLDDLTYKTQLRASTLRAYRYELAAAAKDTRFHAPLPELTRNMVEAWLGSDRPIASTLSRQAATFHRFVKMGTRPDSRHAV